MIQRKLRAAASLIIFCYDKWMFMFLDIKCLEVEFYHMWSKFIRHNIFLRKNILDNKVWQSYVLGVCGAGIWPILDEMRCFKNFVALRNSTFLRRQRTTGRELRGQVQKTRQSIGQKTHFIKKSSDRKQNKKDFKFIFFHFEYNSCRNGIFMSKF